MSKLVYREAGLDDATAMARVRLADWGTEEYWRVRILAYLGGESSPRQGLPSRVGYVCLEDGVVIGLITGHLTRRFGCDGELEWISVHEQYRGSGVAAELLRLLFEWFAGQNAFRICVDVEPDNAVARRFYRRHGAEDFKPHWLIWKDMRQSALTSDSRKTADTGPLPE